MKMRNEERELSGMQEATASTTMYIPIYLRTARHV